MSANETATRVTGVLTAVDEKITLPDGMGHALLIHRQMTRDIEEVKEQYKQDGRTLTTKIREPLDNALKAQNKDLKEFDEGLTIGCTVTPEGGKPVKVKVCGNAAYAVSGALAKGDEVQVLGKLDGDVFIAESIGRVMVESRAQVLGRELGRTSASSNAQADQPAGGSDGEVPPADQGEKGSGSETEDSAEAGESTAQPAGTADTSGDGEGQTLTF